MKFTGRKQELDRLEELYLSDRMELAALYGPPGVGKTALIRQFLTGKRAVYYHGIENSERQNADNLRRSVVDSGLFDGAELPSSLPPLLERIFQLGQTRRLVFVIDDYPCADRVCGELTDSLGALTEKYREYAGMLTVILCGASLPGMEKTVLAEDAPLRGAMTARLPLSPLDFEETCRVLPFLSAEDKALAYGVFGGLPALLFRADPGQSLEENICRLLLDEASPFYRDPLGLLEQETRQPGGYAAILTAIAGGCTRMSEISERVSEDTNVCSAYIKKLIQLGVVRRESPCGEDTARKSRYAIENHMLRFWFRFLPCRASQIALGEAEEVFREIEPGLDGYMHETFADICSQYLWKLLRAGRSPVVFSSLGRWWGVDPVGKRPVEIDILGEQDKDTALFAWCRWTQEPIEAEVLEELIEQSRIFRRKRTYYYFFSRSGFTEECKKLGRALGDVTVVSFLERSDRPL